LNQKAFLEKKEERKAVEKKEITAEERKT